MQGKLSKHGSENGFKVILPKIYYKDIFSADDFSVEQFNVLGRKKLLFLASAVVIGRGQVPGLWKNTFTNAQRTIAAKNSQFDGHFRPGCLVLSFHEYISHQCKDGVVFFC